MEEVRSKREGTMITGGCAGSGLDAFGLSQRGAALARSIQISSDPRREKMLQRLDWGWPDLALVSWLRPCRASRRCPKEMESRKPVLDRCRRNEGSITVCLYGGGDVSLRVLARRSPGPDRDSTRALVG